MDSAIPVFLEESDYDPISIARVNGNNSLFIHTQAPDFNQDWESLLPEKPRLDEKTSLPAIHFKYPLDIAVNKNLINILTYELGHALFGMVDEYESSLSIPILLYYNCAPTLARLYPFLIKSSSVYRNISQTFK